MQSPNHASERASKRGKNNKWIEPALKIDNEQQVDQCHRHHQADRQTEEARAHGQGLTPDDNRNTARQSFFRLRNDWFNIAQDATEVAVGTSTVDVDNRDDVVVRVNRLAGDAGN